MRPTTAVAAAAIDRDGIDGRVLCGYQGWFAAEGDGSGVGWRHWCGRDGRVTVDLLPDVGELPPDDRFPLRVGGSAGPTVEVFSSARATTVRTHFRWMREYGIDGAFVQRFAVALDDPATLAHHTSVLGHCRDAALAEGRVYAVMYDLRGLPAGRTGDVLDDWRRLRSRMGIGDDAASLQLAGRPLVAVWGIGFSDGRAYSLAECADLVRKLKKDGCSVMLGVPTGWRELHRDAVKDPALHDVLKLADVVSPWTVGRYRTPAEAARHGAKVVEPDIAWCRENGPDYMPVAFPGFSWANLKRDASNAIPRLKGEFLWSQFVAAKKAGAASLYVAMFDEVDEGTAIFKCTNDVPVSPQDQFATFEGLPSDFYLKLTGRGARLLRGEIPIDSGQ